MSSESGALKPRNDDFGDEDDDATQNGAAPTVTTTTAAPTLTTGKSAAWLKAQQSRRFMQSNNSRVKRRNLESDDDENEEGAAAEEEEEEEGRENRQNDDNDQAEEEDHHHHHHRPAKRFAREAAPAPAPAPAGIDLKQKKLMELQSLLNQARKSNFTEVKEEERKQREGTNVQRRREQEVLRAEQLQKDEALVRQGIDPANQQLLSVPASSAERGQKQQHKKEKNSQTFAWDKFNPESQYKGYKKRLSELGVRDRETYQKQKQKLGDDFYPDADNLNYGQAPALHYDNVNRMAEELQQHIAKRGAFSRRRQHYEDKFVDAINDRNKHFNEKIGRAFDKYTVEIKQNLERGTAI